jgi:light-regulated signal transduction histidine kinase (bacteriophytochrome)
LNREIAERKRGEKKVQILNEHLEGANRELEAFTYSVAHDLRAPLRHIDGFSKLVLEEHSQGLSEEGRRYLARIREGALRMGSLIDDLLNLARVGRKELTPQMTALSSLVN